MKKLNKKGFTLIELMAVIAILVVIMGLALPNITSSIERSKQKQIESKRKLAVSAGELYFDSHKATCTKERGATLGELLRSKLVTADEIEGICPDKSHPHACCVRYNDRDNKLEFIESTQNCGNTNPCGYDDDNNR